MTNTQHTTQLEHNTDLDIAVRSHAHDSSHLEHNTTVNTTVHDLYRKECAKLHNRTPGTATINTLRDMRSV